jgi:calcium permeable stress-gated cation channel
LRFVFLRAAPSIENVPRPTHKLGFLGLFGEKVDSIDWAKEEIKVCNKLLDEGKAVVHQEDLADHREKVAAQANGELGPEHVKEEGEEPDRFGSRDQQDASSPIPEEPSQHHDDHPEGGVPLSHSQSRTKTAFGQMQTGFQTAGKQALHATTAAAQRTQQAAQQAAAQTKYAAQQAAAQTKQLASQALHRRGESQYPPLNSAFITFNRQIAAHLAYAGLAHHEPYRMSMCRVNFECGVCILIQFCRLSLCGCCTARYHLG